MPSETTGQINASAANGAKPQPVAMEIAVTVNGASTVAGSDKRQPFSETTQTVLVFGSGAVIRLAAAVGPGQLLFVTNEKSKQEVVCQVVKTKQNGSATGYVELKFTETTEDFWGIRAPGNGAARIAPETPTENTVAIKPPEQAAPVRKETSSVATVAAPPSVPPAVVQTSVAPAITASLGSNGDTPAAPKVPAQDPGVSKVPTLSEFLTQGSNGLELKAREKTQLEKAATTTVLSEEKAPSAASVAPRTSGNSDNKPSLSAALGVGPNAAPGSASFDLTADMPAEEVKIPAWLEPLARNSASVDSKPPESVVEAAAVQEDALAGAPVAPKPAQEPEGVPALSAEGRTPNFGASLALDSHGDPASRSGKGWKVGLAVAATLLAAAAIWYWYVNQPQKVSAGGNGTVAEGNPLSLPAPSATAPADTVTDTSNSTKAALSLATSSQPIANLPVSAKTTSGDSNAGLIGTNTAGKSAAPREMPSEIAAEGAVKKPALGEVHLAAPKVTRNLSAMDNTAADPGLALSGAAPADSSGASMLANKGKGPAVPLPVGGDVKVAQLISSVPPVYPQMARTQRVSGNVLIDALIDVNGRVSATRVISGPALLHEAAMSAVRQWKYQPATLNGVSTATHLTVTVQFRLQ